LADALALESPLLSRFDLVMQMRSKQDREHIRELSEEMLQNWSAALQDHLGQPLDEDDQERIDGILSLEDYRAVITRARQLHPQPASEAVIDELSDWFTRQKMALPERYQDAYSDAEGRYEGPPLPVTARKLGAARRIAQASARANLREEVTLADVEVAKEMVSRSLNDLDIPTVHNGGVGGGDVSTPDQSRPSGIST
jgi:replicative DNA helicase Mcm